MAQRDKSQGFGFVYVDLAKILAERDQMDVHGYGPITSDAPQVNFNKDRATAAPEAPGTTAGKPIPAKPETTRERVVAIAQIRENLDRLQSLHHKLHAMLAELNQVTDRNKKKRS